MRKAEEGWMEKLIIICILIEGQSVIVVFVVSSE